MIESTPHEFALPNFQRAEVRREKLESYVLDPHHDDGRHKAGVFKSPLGFERGHWELLAQRLIAGLPYCEARLTGIGVWGAKYEVVLPVEGLNSRTVEVTTVWIVRTNSTFPSLVTAYVTGKE